MKKRLINHWYLPGLLILLAALFLAGFWYGRTVGSQKSAGGRRILHYVDPMNPAHTSSEPGLAPCGMKMEPVYADEGEPADVMLEPGSVRVSAEKQQLIGMRVATVEKSPGAYTLRTVGRVAADETLTYRLNAYSDGFVTKVYDNSTGSLVRKDEPLAKYFSKDLFTELQTYYYAVYALDNLQQVEQLPASQRHLLEAQKEAAEYNLMNLGMSRQQIKDLIRSKAITQEIILSAPATSFVLNRNLTEGQKFTTGEQLYLLADLSRVWILADLFGNEADYVRPGEKVKVTLADRDDSYMATVTDILPEFDPVTLTLRVRLEVDNPHFALRPGMFVDVEVPVSTPPAINVPVDAIVDTGLKQTVFVDRGNGYFLPRLVETGWRLGDRVEIVRGLNAGERIVISGNFLIDSESRMKLAADGFFGNVVKDPVCGMNVDDLRSRAAGLKSEYQGKSYYFCSDVCQKQFNKTPERYAGTLQETSVLPGAESPPQAQIAPQKTMDPVCGHELDEAQAKAAGLTSTHKGKTYYFCSYSCNKRFDKNPEQFVQQGGNSGVQPPIRPETAKDPVCGLTVATGSAKQAGRTSEYKGVVYYFDTDGCKRRFDKDPEHYLSENAESPLPRTFPQVPTNPDLLLRLRRESIRAIPPGRGLAPLEERSGEAVVESPAPQPPLTQPSVPSQSPEQQAPPEQPPSPPLPHHPPDGGGNRND